MSEQEVAQLPGASAERNVSFSKALIGGAVAGFVCDVSLYPLDTIKTRLQSSQGFIRSGGFRGIYKGLGVAALGSAPGAALFFSSYETLKTKLSQYQLPLFVVHMISASYGETMACLVRVPTEVVKQRYQANMFGSRNLPSAIHSIYSAEGIRGFYTGYGITIMREIPFALIQFPLYEAMKAFWRKEMDREIISFEAAVCGSLSSGVAAALTTPLDVAKTRLMLGKDIHGVPYKGIADTLRRLYAEAQGSSMRKVLFAGVEPRIMWLSIGGLVFFGAYEQALRIVGTD